MPDALLKELIPADLHSKPYLKDFLEKPQTPETFAEVFKKLDGAETLIGKKTVPGVPAPDAKDEDWDKFLLQLRPGKPDDYEIPAKEGVKQDEAFIKGLREAFLAGDISKRQAQKFLGKLMPDLDSRAAAQIKAQKDAQTKADADFETLAKAAFGEQNKAELGRARKLLAENCPDVMKPYLDKLDNNQLVILAAAVNGVAKKYMSEDELNPKGGDTGDQGKSVREQAKALMQSKEYTDAFHPEHEKAKAKVRALYEEAAKAGAK